MKEIHLGRVLTEHRRRRGITQEELAEYLGVSKAAVSKWETETSCPDILVLPKLAAYFNITIDQLLDYKPQLTKEELRNMYRLLSGEFASRPFPKALDHCRSVIRQYYSCFPLLFQAASLLINHAAEAGGPEETAEILEEALALFRRVRVETDDARLGTEAGNMEAFCLISLQRPDEALELLEPGHMRLSPTEPLLSAAWRMKGKDREARKILQAGIYQSVLSLTELLANYMELCLDKPASFEATCRLLTDLADSFSLRELHPGILLSCYLAIARGQAMLGETEKALRTLEDYTSLATGDIYPLRLHGNSYFDLLDEWLEDFLELGDYPPRNEALIRSSMTRALSDNPAFAILAEHPRFQSLIARLKANEEEH